MLYKDFFEKNKFFLRMRDLSCVSRLDVAADRGYKSREHAF